MNEETIIENKPLALKSGDAQPTVTNHQFGEKKEKKAMLGSMSLSAVHLAF